jgi:hypothetical protein
MLTDAEIGKIAKEILERRFTGAGFRDLEVASDEDYDGAPIIRMTAHFDGPIDDLRKFVKSTAVIRSELVHSGEERFVYLTHDYPGADLDEDEDVAGGLDRSCP